MDDKDDKGGESKTAKKVDSLQKQYNKILVDLFKQYAPECIEEALEETGGTFGQNIDSVIEAATEKLKGKVYEDLGLGCGDHGDEVGGVIAISAGGPGEGPMGGMDYDDTDSEEVDIDTEDTEEEDEDEE